jgi:hypothetical protein
MLCAALFGVLAPFALTPDRLASARPALFAQEREDPNASLIFALDECIQERFKDVEENFGFRRIIPPKTSPHRFTPENARELGIVKALEKSGLEVALYLAGRSVLGPRPDEAAWRNKNSRPPIQGPALVSAKDRRKGDLPDPSELWEQSRRAMETLKKSDAYDFALRGWSFSARAVRAGDGSCLKCHYADRASVIPLRPQEGAGSPIKVGDILGILLYASDRSAQK